MNGLGMKATKFLELPPGKYAEWSDFIDYNTDKVYSYFSGITEHATALLKQLEQDKGIDPDIRQAIGENMGEIISDIDDYLADAAQRTAILAEEHAQANHFTDPDDGVYYYD